jgi:hypothetical protein
MDSLLLGPNIVQRFHAVDPHIRTSIRGADDGQFIYVELYDPLLLHKNNLDLFDNPKYRYERILYAWIVSLITAGHARFFPIALLTVNIASYLCGLVFFRALTKKFKWNRMLTVGYLTITGLVYSTFRTLTEPLALAMVLAGLYYDFSEQPWKSVIFFSLSILARETFLTVPMALYIWKAWDKIMLPRDALLKSIIVLLPFVLWSFYLHINLPGYSTISIPSYAPPSTGFGRFTFPFMGMWQEGVYGWHHLTTRTEMKRTFSLLFVTVAIILFSGMEIFKKPSPWLWLTVTQGAFLSVMRGDIWNFHASSARTVIPLFLFFILWCGDEITSNDLPRVESS